MNRIFTLHSPLGDDLVFRNLDGHEQLNSLFNFSLTMLSPRRAIQAKELLGKGVTIEIATEDNTKRYLNAQVTRFHKTGQVDRYTEYQAELSPWLWYATRTSDCKIFQQKTVVQIVDEVLADYPFSVKKNLFESYQPIGYAVQYNESDFNFLSRLFEQEGISYYFTHEDGNHTLVLTDLVSGYKKIPDQEEIRFMPADSIGLAGEECILAWNISHAIVPGRFVTDEYDFKKPRARLQQIRNDPKDHANADYEMYHWGHGYTDTGHGEQLARVHLEALQQNQVQIDGETNARGMAPGHTFKMFQHPDPTQNSEYLVTSATYHFNENPYASGADGEHTEWSVAFTAQKSTEQYRPAKITPWPKIAGLHSAKVVGPAGQEIWTDKYGRVKLQFPWDRYGASDENSSCWVRSASPWAGSNFGAVHVPRIGQEVLVEYLNGDPNRPVITGRLYNEDQMPPWDLPANATQSGFLSRSTEQGAYGNANAIRFEDKKGAEQVWIQAERNMDTQVENDETHHVMHDRLKTIDHDETVLVHHDRTETVDNNETITVHNNRVERVDHNETISIGDNRTEDVGQNETLTVGANRTETIGANHTENIGANETVSVGGSRSVTVGGSKSETVAMMKTETIGLLKALTVGGAYQTTVGAAMNTTVALMQLEQVGLSKTVTVGQKISFTAGEQFKIEVGESTFVMNADGRIEITGNEILIHGKKKVEVHGDDVDTNPAS